MRGKERGDKREDLRERKSKREMKKETEGRRDERGYQRVDRDSFGDENRDGSAEPRKERIEKREGERRRAKGEKTAEMHVQAAFCNREWHQISNDV